MFDFATAADTLPNAEVWIHAPMASRIAENARRIRPSNFIKIANYAIKTVYPEAIEKGTKKISIKQPSRELVQTSLLFRDRQHRRFGLQFRAAISNALHCFSIQLT
jgi:hypothetical protein